MSGQGLIHLYFGEGKGKTTAAMGLALRAAGSGVRVHIVQFLKGTPSGEIALLQQLPNVTVARPKAGGKFARQMNGEERQATLQAHTDALRQAEQIAKAGGCGLLVLDEALGAVGTGLLDKDALMALVREKPPALELVLTGRGPWDEILQLADYATEMRMHKHPYTQGVMARKGVEY